MAKKIEQLNEVSNAVLEMLKSKPELKSKSECFPNTHSGVYSQAGLILNLASKYTDLKVCQGLNDLQDCKEIDLRCVKVKNFYYEDVYPYYYFAEFTTDEEAKAIATEYEVWSKIQAKDIMAARKENRKKNVQTTKKRKVSQKQKDALARARAAKQKKKEEI